MARFSWGLCLALAAWLTACGEAAPVASAAPSHYTPEAAALFDDSFHPALFDVTSSHEPEAERHFSERSAAAEAVFAGRIVTVTREVSGDGTTFSVVVQPDVALAGAATDSAITLKVGRSSADFQLVSTTASGLVGKAVIVFVRRFSEGLHFHVIPDTPGARLKSSRPRRAGAMKPGAAD